MQTLGWKRLFVQSPEKDFFDLNILMSARHFRSSVLVFNPVVEQDFVVQ